jgi:dTDP-4-dehydrorhamnose 3,5-epimerase
VIFTETILKGVFLIEPERHMDDRGFFARTWCREEFARHGLNPNLVQCSISFNCKKGTLRGMHYQCSPHAEAKLVRCTMGAIYDVILDLRPESQTFKQWCAAELNAENRRMIFIPEGLAHGFQTLMNDTELYYQMTEAYHPECARGVRWDDPAFTIQWPVTAHRLLSSQDQSYPFFERESMT